MPSPPGSYDRAQGEVYDDNGQRVAYVALDDQRHQETGPSGKPGWIKGEVLGTFEDADPAWAAKLPRTIGGRGRDRVRMIVTIVLDSGERLDGVEVTAPWSDGPAPIQSLQFPLHHLEFP